VFKSELASAIEKALSKDYVRKGETHLEIERHFAEKMKDFIKSIKKDYVRRDRIEIDVMKTSRVIQEHLGVPTRPNPDKIGAIIGINAPGDFIKLAKAISSADVIKEK